jgi:carbon storage regulator
MSILSLTRRPGESIRIGDNIEVTVVRVSPTVVKVGIETPSGIKVVRKELLEPRHDHDRLRRPCLRHRPERAHAAVPRDAHCQRVA